MKIKSILAGIAAVCTLGAISATAFADDAPVLISPAPTDSDDILVISPAPDAGSADELKAKYVEKLGNGFNAVKSEIAKVGGVDAYFEKTRAALKALTPDQIKEFIKDVLKAQGMTDEQIDALMTSFDSASAEDFTFNDEAFDDMKKYYQKIDECKTAEEFADYLVSDEGKEMADAIVYMVGNVKKDDGDISTGTGDNADTGAEGVAAVVGVIAVAGAVVVISRKKA